MDLRQWETEACPQCGRPHHAGIQRVLIGKGVLRQLGEELKALGAKRIFLLADRHTEPLAGERVRNLVRDAGMTVHSFVFPRERTEPDEAAVGSAMSYPASYLIGLTVPPMLAKTSHSLITPPILA